MNTYKVVVVAYGQQYTEYIVKADTADQAKHMIVSDDTQQGVELTFQGDFDADDFEFTAKQVYTEDSDGE